MSSYFLETQSKAEIHIKMEHLSYTECINIILIYTYLKSSGHFLVPYVALFSQT
jgi:hypothetical protein